MMKRRHSQRSADRPSGRIHDADSSSPDAIEVESVEIRTGDVQAVGESSLADTVTEFVKQTEEDWERMRGTIGPF
jgi:hypothetical protein